MNPWTVIFRNGYLASGARVSLDVTSAGESFEDKTLDGHVTYEKKWDILTLKMAALTGDLKEGNEVLCSHQKLLLICT